MEVRGFGDYPSLEVKSILQRPKETRSRCSKPETGTSEESVNPVLAVTQGQHSRAPGRTFVARSTHSKTQVWLAGLTVLFPAHDVVLSRFHAVEFRRAI